MSKKTRPLPAFIDPSTGGRWRGKALEIPVPNSGGKLVKDMTPEEFAGIMFSSKTNEEYNQLSDWFDSVGWPEGFAYCTRSYEYSRVTAYVGFILHP